MSNRPFFLLTGDDSVRAEGIILVKRLVQDWADYQIVATKDQMTGASSRISSPGGTYGTEVVDGHPAIWVSGTPADAAYFAIQHLERPIDLVISGLNLGLNVTNEMHRSGTVGAAVTAAQCRGLKAIAASISSSVERMMMPHNGAFNETLLEYPGAHLLKFIKLALATKFPPQAFWNINFPAEPTNTIKVVPASQSQYWVNDMTITEDTYTYHYTKGTNLEPGQDVYEVVNGAITVTPCKIEYTDTAELPRIEKLLTEAGLSQ